METKPKIIVIVGPTASGKTALSIDIAKKFNGEIISADSRQVYKGLNLGTGKVTEDEMGGIPHHLLDVIDPHEVYTATDFVRDGRTAISEIIQHNKTPIVVGGTFFYIDALIGRVEAPEVPPNEELRQKLEKMSADALYTVLLQHDERRATDIDPHNKRRIIRALEIIETLGVVPEKKSELHYDVLMIGIKRERKTLYTNIHERLFGRIEKGMIEEVETLHAHGLSYERMEELGLEYRYIARYLQGGLTKEKMLNELETKIRQFAKRQMTWLKRDKTIHWFNQKDNEKLFAEIEAFLST